MKWLEHCWERTFIIQVNEQRDASWKREVLIHFFVSDSIRLFIFPALDNMFDNDNIYEGEGAAASTFHFNDGGFN